MTHKYGPNEYVPTWYVLIISKNIKFSVGNDDYFSKWQTEYKMYVLHMVRTTTNNIKKCTQRIKYSCQQRNGKLCLNNRFIKEEVKFIFKTQTKKRSKIELSCTIQSCKTFGFWCNACDVVTKYLYGEGVATCWKYVVTRVLRVWSH